MNILTEVSETQGERSFAVSRVSVGLGYAQI